jgi:hypothetical protein
MISYEVHTLDIDLSLLTMAVSLTISQVQNRFCCHDIYCQFVPLLIDRKLTLSQGATTVTSETLPARRIASQLEMLITHIRHAAAAALL